MTDDEVLVVGRLGRAHGVRGDLAVEVRTDAPEIRFAPGSVLRTDPADRGPLTVVSTKNHSGRLLVHFDGIDDRDAAEQLTGTILVIRVSEAGPSGKDGWWDHELIGLRVEHVGTDNVAGETLGVVADVVHAPAQDLLAITLPEGREVLLPFVTAFVPRVDIFGGRVIVDPPPGWTEP
jgi:16S rRNA processing protein RimM